MQLLLIVCVEVMLVCVAFGIYHYHTAVLLYAAAAPHSSSVFARLVDFSRRHSPKYTKPGMVRSLLRRYLDTAAVKSPFIAHQGRAALCRSGSLTEMIPRTAVHRHGTQKQSFAHDYPPATLSFYPRKPQLLVFIHLR